MTAIPINKSVINFDDDFIRESFSKILKFLTLNHKNILPYLHFDVLPSQKLMIKILNLNENGSLRDTIYKAYPLNSFSKKYPNSKVKGLHNSLISNYGRQILEALNYLHNNKWYHMHLHSGNVLIDNNNSIKLVELENFVNDIPIRNDHLFNYAYESFNSTYYTKNDYNSVILSEIFKNNSNIFEKIDIICFGRILYEMTTGRELKAPFPDPIEYKDIEADISEVLSLIFNKKTSKVNSNFIFTIPEVNASDLLKMKFFNPEDGSNNQESKNF
jgi:serine/threonine protein kinase